MWKEGGKAAVKRKLNYRFHNPNTTAETADCILKILIEANSKKVEEEIQKYSEIFMNNKKHSGQID